MVRNVDIAKEGSAFCYAQFIDSMQKEIFGRLKEDNYLVGLDKEAFAAKLAEVSANLNALHPFRDGNGRAIQAFLTQLAENAGYRLTFENEQREELLSADIAAFKGDHEPLKRLFSKLIAPI